MSETVLEELERLVAEHRKRGGDGSERYEAWNMIAECVIERFDELKAIRPSPAGVEDRQAALNWLQDNISEEAVEAACKQTMPDLFSDDERVRYPVVASLYREMIHAAIKAALAKMGEAD